MLTNASSQFLRACMRHICGLKHSELRFWFPLSGCVSYVHYLSLNCWHIVHLLYTMHESECISTPGFCYLLGICALLNSSSTILILQEPWEQKKRAHFPKIWLHTKNRIPGIIKFLFVHYKQKPGSFTTKYSSAVPCTSLNRFSSCKFFPVLIPRIL